MSDQFFQLIKKYCEIHVCSWVSGGHYDSVTENSTPEFTPGNDPPSANEEVAKLRLELNHRSLEELEEEGLVKWDRDEHIVNKGPKFDDNDTGENQH